MVDLRDDNFERVKYSFGEVPVYAEQGCISSYPNYREVAHWHNDIELIAVLSGHMQFSVNGAEVTINDGEGLFVNSKQVHFGFSSDRGECRFICVLIEPFSLCPFGWFAEKYVSPLVAGSPFRVFSRSDRPDLFGAIEQMYAAKSSPASPVMAVSLAMRIWGDLCSFVGLRAQSSAPPQGHAPDSLRNMLAFIYKHYGEKLALSDIARAGNVCKSGCIALFRQYLRATPVNYLNEYRLHMAKDMLEKGHSSVTEVSMACGFPSVSYFISLFGAAYGAPPLKYARAARGGEQFTHKKI